MDYESTALTAELRARSVPKLLSSLEVTARLQLSITHGHPNCLVPCYPLHETDVGVRGAPGIGQCSRGPYSVPVIYCGSKRENSSSVAIPQATHLKRIFVKTDAHHPPRLHSANASDSSVRRGWFPVKMGRGAAYKECGR